MMKRILVYIIVLIMVCMPVTAMAEETPAQTQETAVTAEPEATDDSETHEETEPDAKSETTPKDTVPAEDKKRESGAHARRSRSADSRRCSA